MKKGLVCFLVILALLIGAGAVATYFKWDTVKGWFEKKDNTEKVENNKTTTKTTLTIDTQNLKIK